MKVNLDNAQNICSLVRKNFPYESPWLQARIMLDKYNSSPHSFDKNLAKKLIKEQKIINEIRDKRDSFIDISIQYFKVIIDLVQKYKIQNCGELARIAYAVSRINCISDTKLDLAHIFTKNRNDVSNRTLSENFARLIDILQRDEAQADFRKIDHVALSLNADENNKFVVDPLFNISDKAEIVESIYDEKYPQILGIKPDEAVGIMNFGKDVSNLPSLNDDDSIKLARLYPNLVLPENRDKLLKSNQFYFD